MATGRKSDFTLPTFDSIFSTQEERDEAKLAKIRDIPISEIDDFPDHPFKVRDDEDMLQLVESIKERGVITPATVRQKEDGRYELISGHRRKRASEIAGFETLRCEVVDLTREEATILMVESNFQRSQILPSEKAFAYKMRLEAMKRQGYRSDLTSTPVGQKYSVEVLADNSNDSKTQIQRYIRLNNLLPELLKMVDEERIALTPAVELSYLSEDEQKWLLETIETEEATPSLSQAQEMKNLSQAGMLDMDQIFSIMVKPKANQKEVIKIKVEVVDKYLKGCTTPKEREDFLLKACEYYSRFLQRQRNKDRGAR